MRAGTKTAIGRRGVSAAGWSLALVVGSTIWVAVFRVAHLL